jgi:hypothetical protein
MYKSPAARKMSRERQSGTSSSSTNQQLLNRVAALEAEVDRLKVREHTADNDYTIYLITAIDMHTIATHRTRTL